MVGQRCGPCGRLPNQAKVDAIREMKACESVSEVRRFVGACVFYRVWIPHFAHIADPLYELLRKKVKFRWSKECERAMAKLKELLISPPVLRPPDYTCGRPLVLTIDSSPLATGWVLGQEDGEDQMFATRFGAKIFNERQRRYPQVKRELWGAKCALKQEKDYLIGTHVVLQTDCLPLLGTVANCDTPDIAMLRWIAFIRMFNPELEHIMGKNNLVADMLLRARFEGCESCVSVDRCVCVSSHKKENFSDFKLVEFKKELYSADFVVIGEYLSTLRKKNEWSREEF